MRDFSWQYFSLTGDVDAYLLYNEINKDSDAEDVEEDQDSESGINLQ